MTEKLSHKKIYKTTLLFSLVKVFQILVGIIRNKVIAILLGPEGIGIIGILTSTVSLLQKGSSLGVAQSAVRDVSEAKSLEDFSKYSRIISLTKQVVIFTGLFGCVLTIVISPLLSEWTFGNNSYTLAYLWLAIVVGLNILAEGQLAILNGIRQLRQLAKASVMGSVVGLVSSTPLYYFYGKSGIVPSLIIAAIASVIFSSYFVSKIKYNKAKLPLKEIYNEASPMIKMGIALMFVGFLGLGFELIIASYIRSHGGLEIVGFYRAGTTIISSYFGIVLTAMTTDYYPRISSVHFDNIKLQEELNRQSEVGLILIFPIAVLFVFLSPLFIQLLYTKEFIETISYTDFAILGTILVVCSNNMGMILLAKQDARTFTVYSLIHQLLFIPIYIILYNYYALLGLGIAFLTNVFVQLLVYCLINKFKYDIKFKLYKMLIIVFTTVLLTILFRKIETIEIKYFFGFLAFIFSCVYSYKRINEVMNINIWNFIHKKWK